MEMSIQTPLNFPVMLESKVDFHEKGNSRKKKEPVVGGQRKRFKSSKHKRK